MAKHARLSPSSADRWTTCTASPAAQDGIPNTNSDASRMGTVCHQIAEECLLDEFKSPFDYVGREFVFYYLAETERDETDWSEDITDLVWNLMGKPEAVVTVTDDMAAAVATGVAYVKEQHELLGGKLFVEQRVPVGQFTDEDDAEGSADVIFLGADWACVKDFKFGRKRVNASRLIIPQHVDFITGAMQPEKRGPNLQMACYALGALHKHDLFGEVKTVTMTIVQPFIDHTDSYTCTIEELRATERFLAAKAEETRTNPKFAPSFEACIFCRAKGTCNAQADKALRTVFDMFDDNSGVPRQPGVPSLGSQYALLHFVEQWTKDVHAAVETALLAGEPVVRDDGLSYKLVDGKNGPRQWTDADAAETTLESTGLPHDVRYSYSLISPTQTEKLAVQKKKGPPPLLDAEKWEAMQPLIKQSKGKPQIALETDPRPAITKADGFEEVPTTGETL